MSRNINVEQHADAAELERVSHSASGIHLRQKSAAGATDTYNVLRAFCYASFTSPSRPYPLPIISLLKGDDREMTPT